MVTISPVVFEKTMMRIDSMVIDSTSVEFEGNVICDDRKLINVALGSVSSQFVGMSLIQPVHICIKKISNIA